MKLKVVGICWKNSADLCPESCCNQRIQTWIHWFYALFLLLWLRHSSRNLEPEQNERLLQVVLLEQLLKIGSDDIHLERNVDLCPESNWSRNSRAWSCSSSELFQNGVGHQDCCDLDRYQKTLKSDGVQSCIWRWIQRKQKREHCDVAENWYILKNSVKSQSSIFWLVFYIYLDVKLLKSVHRPMTSNSSQLTSLKELRNAIGNLPDNNNNCKCNRDFQDDHNPSLLLRNAEFKLTLQYIYI